MFSIRDYVKEDHCDAPGLSKNRTKSVLLRGIDCIDSHGLWASITIRCLEEKNSKSK